MKNKYSQKTNRKFVIIGLVIAVILLAAGVYAYSYSHRAPTVITTPSGKIDLHPPTKAEKQATEAHKDELVQQQQQQSQPTTGLKTVAPVIVDASQYDQAIEVRAYEPGVTESGAVCNIVFTQGARSVKKRVDAIADATTTRCTNLSVPRSEFSASGSWQVTVSYISPTTTGSTIGNIEIK